MALTAAVAAALATLSQAVHDPGPGDVGLGQLLGEFARGTKRAVHSYLGVSLNIATAAENFSLTAMDDPRDVAGIVTSLHLPLKATPEATTNSTVTFYAADLGWSLTLPPGLLILDGHLTIPDQDPDTGLGAIALVNQATGVLIGGGHSPGAREASCIDWLAAPGFPRSSSRPSC